MSLKEFLKKMQNEGQILRINNEVSPSFEASYILKEFDCEGPILTFSKVKGFETQIAGNVCGTRRRLCSALNVKQNELYERLSRAWDKPKDPKISSDGPVKEVTEKVDLRKIPVLTHFERDAGPYITSAVVHAKGLDGKIENASIHRLQLLDKNHLAIRLVPRHLFKLWSLAKETEQDLDVAISIGLHPAVLLAASSPLSYGVSEFSVANELLDGKLEIVECENVDAYAPAVAELLLEGRISAHQEITEGPFVDITGTYDIQRKQPIVEIIGVSHQRDYIYEALLPSGSEHKLLMGLPHETLIWNAVSKVVPKVHAVNLTGGGCGWLHAVISIDKNVDGDSKNALLAALAAHPSLKHAVAVDSDIDVRNLSDIEWAIATRFQASEDLIVIENVRGSTLDSSANQETGLTSKIGIDATCPLTKPKEKFERAKIPAVKDMKTLVQKRKEIARM